MLLILIPFIPGVIIVLLLRDRNKHLNDSSTNKILNIIISVSVFACFWFGSIALLYGTIKIFVMPTMNKLALPPVKGQILPISHTDGDDICLMGLKIKHPVQGLTANVISPIFNNHSLEGVCIFLNDRNTHAGNIFIYKHPDNMRVKCDYILPSNVILNSIIMFNMSRYDLIDKFMRADVSDFSLWNLFYDIKLLYMLINKAIFLPYFCEKSPVFNIKTDHFSGYLFTGKFLKENYIKQLVFAKNGYLYEVTIRDKNNKDFSEFLSNLSVASDSDAEDILNSYSKRAVSKDIELASKLSRKVNIEDLENIIALIGQHKAAGDKTPKTDLNKELLYLKNINK